MAKKPNRKLRGLRYQQRGLHKKFTSPEHRGGRSQGAADQITRALARKKEQGDGG